MQLRIRISDSVLEPEDWPVMRLSIGPDLKIQDRTQERLGAYDFLGTPNIGQGLEDLSLWLRHDATGQHPETFHEILIGDCWRSFVTPMELAALVRRHLGVAE